MTDTVVSDGRIFPRDEGLPGVSDGEETWDSAGYQAALAQAVDSDSYVRSDSELAFTNHDGANDQVDVTGGIAYLSLEGETVNYQSALGGSSEPPHDTALPTLPAVVCVLPTTVADLSVSSATLNDVWLAFAADDSVTGVAAGDVYIRHGSGLSAPPHPSVKLGQANPDDATADVLSNRGASPTFDQTTHDTISTQTFDVTKQLDLHTDRIIAPDGSTHPVTEQGYNDAVALSDANDGAVILPPVAKQIEFTSKPNQLGGFSALVSLNGTPSGKPRLIRSGDFPLIDYTNGGTYRYHLGVTLDTAPDISPSTRLANTGDSSWSVFDGCKFSVQGDGNGTYSESVFVGGNCLYPVFTDCQFGDGIQSGAQGVLNYKGRHGMVYNNLFGENIPAGVPAIYFNQTHSEANTVAFNDYTAASTSEPAIWLRGSVGSTFGPPSSIQGYEDYLTIDEGVGQSFLADNRIETTPLHGVSGSAGNPNYGNRNIINSMGYNAGDPSSTGAWNGSGVEGVRVFDTTNNSKYWYVRGSWV